MELESLLYSGTSVRTVCIWQHTNDFALYTKAIKFFNHSESMVRIAVRTITLNVYRGKNLLVTLFGLVVCSSAYVISFNTTRRAKKSIPLKSFADFSRNIERYNIKFYTLVIHSVIHKCGKFDYITYIIDTITLLLLVAT